MTNAAVNKAAVQASIDAFNERDWTKFLEVCTIDSEIIDVPSGERYRGHEGWMQFNQRAVEAFPDCTLTLTEIVADDHFVATQCIFKGTQTGTLRMTNGEIPPTNKAVEVLAAGWFPMADGKIAAYKRYSDLMAVMSQLGFNVNVTP